MAHLDEIAPDAAIIGAVNTVRREGERLIGENTDGKGFLRGVRADAGVEPSNKRVVVLGAGGAGGAAEANWCSHARKSAKTDSMTSGVKV